MLVPSRQGSAEQTWVTDIILFSPKTSLCCTNLVLNEIALRAHTTCSTSIDSSHDFSLVGIPTIQLFQKNNFLIDR